MMTSCAGYARKEAADPLIRDFAQRVSWIDGRRHEAELRVDARLISNAVSARFELYDDFRLDFRAPSVSGVLRSVCHRYHDATER